MSDGTKSNGFDAGALLGRLQAALRSGDVLLAMGVIIILTVLIFPMPGWLLDISLALSITLSVLILMTSLFIEKPLDFSAFPTVLLIATMLRLALNLASTRLILEFGHEGTHAAGDVIAAFGDLIMGGNFLIGIIVFAILVIVNFVVITKGSGRIAEVAARFTLDAMPGKQMAIDADLSAGLLTEDEARKRRSELEQESTFFGAMDGAAKFVRGDAIAGLLITAINLIGGIIIGTMQEGMSAGDAMRTYSTLTVGDGLVSQFPALIVSTAAGLMVTKGGTRGTADKAFFGQLGGSARAMGMASALAFVLALLPGMPAPPFLILAAGAGYAAYRIERKQTGDAEAATARTEAEQRRAVPAEEPISAALAIDSIRLELGYGLIPLINDATGTRITDQIKALRRQIAAEMGFVMPSVRILDNVSLPPNTYVLRLKEMEAGKGDIRPHMLLAMDPRGDAVSLPGEPTVEPTFGLAATWIDPSLREEAQFRGLTVVDPATVISTHLTEMVKDNMAELLSYAETQKLLDELPKPQQKLVADLIPSRFTLAGVQRVLQQLLSERISIRDLPTILEGIGEAVGYSQNVMIITEHVRSRLARQISFSNTGAGGYIPLLPLSPDWEQAFAEALIGPGEEKQLTLAPSRLQQFIQAVKQAFDRIGADGELPVLLTSPAIRPYVRSIIERFRPQTVVMSQNEIHPRARIRTLGQI
ncbi:flagellar biosynthesis protein FlhA [Zavarzinia compransoris]|uniref:Flagellar biosynthesis protein FlhA n=1 Tax=Zavarzinia compransoris TaxID=1264899 RepID=A0A317E5F7_9PROT|nr:flagellar biosynthesis protein FlhA [Zavarzinia compransoris]PWR21822.1 flagellar biosynthesis protein FlhA [Zavarzinia compransoris]TDP45378.1 flagellar biosynthesis protein FlhA [Zavarzinia compransoris]